MTPEGRVKDKVKKIIAKYKPHVYTHWPVMNGMGDPTLDCTGCVLGLAFWIETKAPGKKLTERQAMTVNEIRAAGGLAFVIDGSPDQLEQLDVWLASMVREPLQSQEV